MTTFITVAGLGLLVSVLGIVNMTGNISSLHWYHRQRVTEENRKPFGRLVGLGTLVIGVSMIFYSALTFVAEITKNDIFTIFGSILLILGIVLGLGLNFYAMIKYNKGIF